MREKRGKAAYIFGFGAAEGGPDGGVEGKVEEESDEFAIGFEEGLHFFGVIGAEGGIDSAEEGLFDDEVEVIFVGELEEVGIEELGFWEVGAVIGDIGEGGGCPIADEYIFEAFVE